MESNKIFLMFLILIAMVSIEFADGSPKDAKTECLKHFIKLCGSNPPNVSGCGRGAILNFRLYLDGVPHYIKNYFRTHISNRMTLPGLQSREEFCKKQVKNQRDLGGVYDRNKKTLREYLNADIYDEYKKTIREYLLDTESDEEYEMTLREQIEAETLIEKCTEDLIAFRDNDEKEWIIQYAVFYVSLAIYEDKTLDSYQDNENAKNYLIHISEKVVIEDKTGLEPDAYCSLHRDHEK